MIAPPPHLDVYYASTCAPCRIELPVLLQAIDLKEDIRILIVSDAVQSMEELSAAGRPLAAAARIAAGDTPRDRLRHAGDADEILPFTNAVNGAGRPCASWRGILTISRIRDLLASCARISAPASR